jgi:hypothetical protein
MKKYPLLIVTLLVLSGDLYSCTLFWTCLDERILCAKNMDWMNTDARMLFLPSSADKLGRMYIGVESAYGFTNTGGMNEAGLWYGGASLPPRNDVYNTHNKPRWDYELIEKIMEECSTVEEALEIYSTYWEPYWDGHTLLADRHGHCAVIYYGEDDVEFIRKEKGYQVITNFYLSDTLNARWYQCHRYATASTILDSCTAISAALFRFIADQVHAEGTGHPTVLTAIHDLHSGDIELNYMHNFHECLRLNLYTELEKGEHYVRCSDLFSKIKLIGPGTGTTVLSNSVTLRWSGDDEQYLVRYSKDPGFSAYEEIEYRCLPGETTCGSVNAWLFFLIVPILLCSGRKTIPTVLALTLFFSISCEKLEVQPQYSNRNHAVEIDVSASSTYYWQVISQRTKYSSESQVWSFTSGQK